MARYVDFDALINRLQATDIYMAIIDGEPTLIAACMLCDATLVKALGAEANAAELYLAIVEHDCDNPGDTVVIDDQAEIADYVMAVTVTAAEEPPAMAEERVPARVLHTSDRCDKCGAPAFVRVETKGGPVDLCGHDYAAAELTITAAGYPVVDERAHI